MVICSGRQFPIEREHHQRQNIGWMTIWKRGDSTYGLCVYSQFESTSNWNFNMSKWDKTGFDLTEYSN